MSYQDTLTDYLASFIDGLYQAGLRDVVISPGSRSTPLSLLFADHPHIREHIMIDERSAGFFALGIAKKTLNPVALVCTSGTAAANYYPAVIESEASGVPLIVLTADRPHELRDIGAPQAIDQIHLYGNHVKWFMEMALAEQQLSTPYANSMAARAVYTANHLRGPVHLNFPIREPLLPRLTPSPFLHATKNTQVVTNGGSKVLPKEQLEVLSQELLQKNRGIIVCGPISSKEVSDTILQFAEKLGFPVLADPLSQMRTGEKNGALVIDSYDALLKIDKIQQQANPDIVIRFGGMPVSKPLMLWTKQLSNAVQWVVNATDEWIDPQRTASVMIHAEETSFCEQLMLHASAFVQNTVWLNKWYDWNSVAVQTIHDALSDIQTMDEGKLVIELTKQLPENSHVVVSNSMPIRDIDTFFHNNDKNISIYANRGANGIDGVVSTAMGVASHADGPTFLLIGDLAFYHDLNGLLAAKLYGLNITVIVINNNGGGIFSFLPQAKEPKYFEAIFGTPMDIQFEYAVKMYGGTYYQPSNWDAFRTELAETQQTKGLYVFEIFTNREENVSIHRSIWDKISLAIEAQDK